MPLAQFPVPFNANNSTVVDTDPRWGVMSNVMPVGGVIHTRPGFDKLTGAAITEEAHSLHFHNTTHLIAGGSTRLEAFATSSWAIAASLTGLSAGTPWGFATVATPGSTTTYAGNGANTLRKWNGSAWSSPGATMPKGKLLATWAQANRLVNAGFVGATDGPSAAASNDSRVWFSDASAPETWGATNYVDLTPGDGEAIQALCAWRDMLFVFKKTKFFVFYGESVDGTGNPVFNYRAVQAAAGAAGSQAVCATQEGVYFVSRLGGMFQSTGGDPVRVHHELDGVFRAVPSISTTAVLPALFTDTEVEKIALRPVGDGLALLYVSTASVKSMLLYKPSFGWIDWEGAPYALGVSEVNDSIYSAYNGTQVAQATLTNVGGSGDLGGAGEPAGSVSTSAAVLGEPDLVKRVRALELRGHGTGNITVTTYNRDFSVINPVSGTVDVDNNRTGWFRKAVRGKLIPFTFAIPNGAHIRRVVAHVAPVRTSGVDAIQ